MPGELRNSFVWLLQQGKHTNKQVVVYFRLCDLCLRTISICHNHLKLEMLIPETYFAIHQRFGQRFLLIKVFVSSQPSLVRLAQSNKTYKGRGFHRGSICFGKQWYLHHLLLGSSYVITLVGRQLYTAAGWSWFLEGYFIISITHHTDPLGGLNAAKINGYTVTSATILK